MWIGDCNWGGRLASSQRGRLLNFTQIRRGVRANILTMESPDAAARHQKEKSKNATEGQGEPVSNIEQTHSGRRGSVFAIVAGSGLPEWHGGPRPLPADRGRYRFAGEDMPGDRHPDLLRELAAECVALAERTVDPDYRVELLMIAQKWVAMANDREAVAQLSDAISLAPK
jgi:hypothetical protein